MSAESANALLGVHRPALVVVLVSPGKLCDGETMQIVARLDETTLRTMLAELLPVTVLLDAVPTGNGNTREGRWIRLEPAHHVDFVAGEGLRLGTSGKIRWIAAGVPLEATLHSATVMLRPMIVGEPSDGRLVFRPELEAADLKNVPSWLDRGIVSVVNGQLGARADEIAWDFGRTLGVAVPIPPVLEEISNLKIEVQSAVVTVTDHDFELVMTVGLDFVRASGT
ncbi:MAG TPA: hypothetical protein VGF45_01175 [Polyangia bacterium]